MKIVFGILVWTVVPILMFAVIRRRNRESAEGALGAYYIGGLAALLWSLTF